MCVGIAPVLSLVAGIGQAVMGYQGAKAEYKAREQQYAANLENAKTATFDRFDSINNRVLQEEAAASQDLMETSIDALKARSSTRTAAVEGGVTGVSVDGIIGDMLAKEGRYQVNTAQNFEYQKDYWRGEGAAASAQGQNQVNSVQRIAKPSFLPFAMQAFGSAVSAFG